MLPGHRYIDLFIILLYNIEMLKEVGSAYVPDIHTERLKLDIAPVQETELGLIRAVETAVRDRISFKIDQGNPVVPENATPQSEKIRGNCSVMALHTANTLNRLGIYANIGRFGGNSLCIAQTGSGETYFISADYQQYTFPQKHSEIKPSIVSYQRSNDPRISHAVMQTERHDRLARANNTFKAFHAKHPLLDHEEIIGTISTPKYAYLALESKRELVTALKNDNIEKAMEELSYHNVLIEAGTTPESNNILDEFMHFLQRGVARGAINGYEALAFAETFFATLPDTPEQHGTHSALLNSLAEIYLSRGDRELSDGFKKFAKNLENQAMLTNSAF